MNRDWAEQEMVDGYFDGRKPDNPEPSSNRSRSYRHGFQSGRDDLVRQPSAPYDERRRMAEEALAEDASLSEWQPRRCGVTYSELLPPGTRIKVKAGRGEGADQDWNGHEGAVLRVIGNQWAEIQMDKRKKMWPSKVVIIGCSNVHPC